MIFHGNNYLALSGLADTPSPAVKQLQQALAQLAVIVGDRSIDPGPPSGQVDETTRLAVANALRVIAPHLPSREMQIAVTGLSVALPMTSNADQLIRNNAELVTSAIFVAVNSIKASTPPPPPLPWWQTGWGQAGLLSFAGVLALVLLMRRQRHTEAA